MARIRGACRTHEQYGEETLVAINESRYARHRTFTSNSRPRGCNAGRNEEMAMKNAKRVLLCVLAGLVLAACKQESLTGPEETNLAGCPVPAGITHEAAEKITCDKESLAGAAATPVSAPETPATATPALAVTPDADVITAAIAEQARKDGSREITSARSTAEGDLNGDGVADVVVLYRLGGTDGGIDTVRYLAGFVREAGQLTLVDTTSVGASAQHVRVEPDGTVGVTLLLPSGDNAVVEEEDAYLLSDNMWMPAHAHP